ncbi:MAG: Gfo/Idh/MocA family oxidoreductase [Armatimonadetes bacterium]|nr:Gfo/Idh/MocA family oxidoreductase [Armatimonadota bacterium]
MKQVSQDLKTGALRVVEAPKPALQPHGVLVRTSHPIISVGTERSKVELGRSSVLGKVRKRSDDAAKVSAKVKRDGPLNTYKMVRERLAEASPLGYSAAGVVEAAGELTSGLAPGDRVACAGAGYANHAEHLYVPGNLCVHTHRCLVDRAPEAYELVTGKTGERFIGVVLEYPESPAETGPVVAKPAPATAGPDGVGIGVTGAGDFVTAKLLPALKGQAAVSLMAANTAGGLSAQSMVKRHGFGVAADSPEQIPADPSVHGVIIRTRHDSHAELAVKALRAGKSVFVEEPLAGTRDELDAVVQAWASSTILTFLEAAQSTAAMLCVVESLTTGQAVEIPVVTAAKR